MYSYTAKKNLQSHTGNEQQTTMGKQASPDTQVESKSAN